MRRAIEASENVLAFSRISSSLKDIRGDIVEINKVDEIIPYIEGSKDVLILASGDPCFFGLLEYLKKKGIAIKKVLPGLSSFQYMMARLNKSWQDAVFISLHGRDGDLSKVKKHKLSILLTDRENSPSNIAKELGNMGMKGKVYIGYNLSYDDEKIIKKEIGEEFQDVSHLSIMVIENEMD